MALCRDFCIDASLGSVYRSTTPRSWVSKSIREPSETPIRRFAPIPIAAITTFLSKYVKPQAQAGAIPRDDDDEAEDDVESEDEDLLDDMEDMNVEGQDGGRRTKAKYMKMFVSSTR
jgi:hypothetical protein